MIQNTPQTSEPVRDQTAVVEMTYAEAHPPPPPMTLEQTTISMDCKVCFEQMSNVLVLPCRKYPNFSHRRPLLASSSMNSVSDAAS